MTALFAMFVMLFVKAEIVTDIPTPAFLTAFVALLGGYIGFNVLNNGVKGKCWNTEMYDRENKE